MVTGLGLVTPLATGVAATWQKLIDSQCGIRKLGLDDLKLGSAEDSLKEAVYDQLTSRIAATVRIGDGKDEYPLKEWEEGRQRKAAFVQFALKAAREALADAAWAPTTLQDCERTVGRTLCPALW